MRKYIVPLSLLGMCVLLPKQAYSIEMIRECKNTTINAAGVGGNRTWKSQTCWWEAIIGSGSGGGSDHPLPGGGSGISGETYGYSYNDYDLDGDHLNDCWKNVVEEGDHVLDDGDDFGMRVLNGQNDMHDGIDIQAPYGTIIRSPAYGEIIGVEQTDSGANGAYVRMRYMKDHTLYEAVMIHMVEDSPTVEVGSVVYPGSPLGMVNSTGASTGNHLHFQLYVIDTPISPDGINPVTRKPYNYRTLGPKTPIDPVPRMGGSICETSE